ncbi:formimidoylglutamase [Corynebacterium phoceense]|uniref:Formimidoylglutamase n=1 Tax=Corynebacterium phoceense TaxID=1686286 RepID=A0A540R4G6_9CORY|nr:formimidoylglutamase [Corynebacterium phoceense]TQE42631.1 formimidoylglutamase [Corynebacterium phoceense]
MFTPAPAWTGRNDGPGPEHARWHSVINTSTAPGAALLGFATDEGVRRNGGRVGAADGPDALRAALGSLAVHDEFPRIDAGTVVTEGEDLESAQAEVSDKVEELVRAGHLPIVLGGGHETSFATGRGLARVRPSAIINLDAHFDLRIADQPTSGTPFRQLVDVYGDDFDYSVLGISRPNNTKVLFDTARDLGVKVVLDEDLSSLSAQDAAARAVELVADAESIHLSIDLDVLPAAVAPGVSAPAGLGVPLLHIHAIVRALAATGKLALVDVAELNPRFDIDGRTAKAAARLIDSIVVAHAEARS